MISARTAKPAWDTDLFWSARARAFDAIYDYESWWDRLVHRPLRIRHELAVSLLRETGAQTVCDVGCGSGRQLAGALHAGAMRCVGIDAAAEMVELARARFRAAGLEDRVEIVHGDALAWSPCERFDVVWALGVLDYVADPDAVLRKLLSLSRGHVLVTWRRLWAIRSPLRKVAYRLKGRPIYLHTRCSIAGALARAGFTEFSVRRLTAGMYVSLARCGRSE